jgi:hypothetical protein
LVICTANTHFVRFGVVSYVLTRSINYLSFNKLSRSPQDSCLFMGAKLQLFCNSSKKKVLFFS